jgi:integration host factor subunit alpha
MEKTYMTKADIAGRIQIKTGMTKRDSGDILEALFSIIKKSLEDGENVKVSGFGSFEVKQKKDRLGRNPHTGQSLTIEARKILTFKSSAVLRRAVNKASEKV